ncbi:MAG: carboxypeptidase regulatory-like domain-containing protein [Bacteroidetes bacterium]|nr:carboxypeptidase regulatory-like domain-containing protein [Bacteroidota bacterium]
MSNQNYHCKQLELYAAARFSWRKFIAFISQFNAFKGFYNVPYANARLAEIDAAQAIPDEQVRGEAAETLHITLNQKAETALNRWQDLKRYIADAFTEELQITKLQAAGSELYEPARQHDWESLQGLMNDGLTFIANHFADLTAGNNMPPAFQTTFNTAKTNFELTYNQFLDAETDEPVSTQAKVDANNNVFDKLMKMLLDGQQIFRTNDAVKNHFTFTHTLGIISAPGDCTLKGRCVKGIAQTPEEGVRVTIPELGQTVFTDAEGKYNISGFASGNYSAILEKNTLQTQTFTDLSFDPGTSITRNATMIPNA